MGKKLNENHNISEEMVENAAEALIKQQNAGEEFVLGEEEAKEEKIEEEKIEKEEQPQEESTVYYNKEPLLTEKKEEGLGGGTVILTRAATYFDCGIRFYKNVPTKIIDQKVYEHLLHTGLFAHL